LKFHIKILNQIIKILSAVKACIKSENETLYNMNIVINKSARLFKVEWIKKMKCYNYEEIDHLLKHCKKLKKNWKSDSLKKNDKKIEDKKSDNWVKKTTQQQAQATKKDFESNENSNNKFSKTVWYIVEDEIENENERAYQAQTDLHWVINLSATAHYIDNWLIFENLILWIDKLITADEF
jgi:hypothetical protein